jgi:hypothetical protein
VAVLPDDPETKTQLSEITYRMVNDQIELEPKEGDPEQNKKRARPMKHPDDADAYALTYAADVKPKERDEYHGAMLAGAGAGARDEYVPPWQR